MTRRRRQHGLGHGSLVSVGGVRPTSPSRPVSATSRARKRASLESRGDQRQLLGIGTVAGLQDVPEVGRTRTVGDPRRLDRAAPRGHHGVGDQRHVAPSAFGANPRRLDVGPESSSAPSRSNSEARAIASMRAAIGRSARTREHGRRKAHAHAVHPILRRAVGEALAKAIAALELQLRPDHGGEDARASDRKLAARDANSRRRGWDASTAESQASRPATRFRAGAVSVSPTLAKGSPSVVASLSRASRAIASKLARPAGDPATLRFRPQDLVEGALARTRSACAPRESCAR